MTKEKLAEANCISNKIYTLKTFKSSLEKSDDFNFNFFYSDGIMRGFDYDSSNISKDFRIELRDIWITAIEQKIEELKKEFENL